MRTRTLLLVLLALALAVAGCQTGDTDTDDGAAESPSPSDADEGLERISQAAENTVDEGTARFTMTVGTGDTAGTDTGTDGAGGDASTMTLEAEGEENFEEELRRLVVQGPQGELEIVVDGSEVYLQLPATEEEQWARMDLDELADDNGVGFGGPVGVPFQDSRSNLEILQDVTGEVNEVGEEDVRGDTTTHYELTIDLEEAAAQAEAEAGATLEQLSEQTGLEELDMQVWISEDDLIRRVAYSVDLSEIQVDQGAGADGTNGDDSDMDTTTDPDGEPGADVQADPQDTVTVTVEYYDFGTELDIEVPDDENVIDLDEEQLRQSFGQPGAQQRGSEGGAGGAGDGSGGGTDDGADES